MCYAKDLEKEKRWDEAIDVYSKAMKALENVQNPNPKLSSKISKAKGLAMTMRVEKMTMNRHLGQNRDITKSELEYFQELSSQSTVKKRPQSQFMKRRNKEMSSTKLMARPMQSIHASSQTDVKGRRDVLPLDTPFSKGTKGGGYVIKKNSFMVSKRPSSVYRGEKTQPRDQFFDSSQDESNSQIEEVPIGDGEAYDVIDGGSGGKLKSGPFISQISSPTVQRGTPNIRITTGGSSMRTTQKAPGFGNAFSQASNAAIAQAPMRQNFIPQEMAPIAAPAAVGRRTELYDEDNEYGDMKNTLKHVSYDEEAERIKGLQKRMYKVKGNHAQLAVSEQEAMEVLEDQKLIKTDNSNTNKFSQRLKDERISFLNHLSTGAPLKTQGRIDLVSGDSPSGSPRNKLRSPQSPSKRLNLNPSRLPSEAELDEDGSPKSPGQGEGEEPDINNDDFLKRIFEKAGELKANEGNQKGGYLNENEMALSEEINDIEDDEDGPKVEKVREFEDQSEASFHSVHDSVIYKPMEDVDDESKNVAACVIQSYFRGAKTRLHKKHKTLDKSDLIFISRHFKKLTVRDSKAATESEKNYIITFKVEKKNPPKKASEKNMLDLSENNEPKNSSEFSEFLRVSAVCQDNFLLNCEERIDVERYMADRSPSTIKEKLNPGGMTTIARAMVDNMYVVDRDLYYLTNLTNIINQPIELHRNLDDDSTTDEKLGNSDKEVNKKLKKLHDGTIFDDIPAVVKRALKKEQDEERPYSQDEYLKSVIKIQRFLKRKFKELVKEAFDHSNLNKARRILFNGLAKTEENHYVNVVCLLNHTKEKRGEVHAFDFNTMNKLDPLILKEKVMYTTDLDIPDIFKKINLNTQENRVEITEFNRFKINQERYLQKVYNMNSKDRTKLVKLQSFIKKRILSQDYKNIYKKHIKMRQELRKNIILKRYYKVHGDALYLVVIMKHKFDNTIIIQARTQRQVKTIDGYKNGTIPLELTSPCFKLKNDQMEAYIESLYSRLYFTETPAGLTMQLEFCEIENKFEVKNAKLVADVGRGKDDCVTAYFRDSYKAYNETTARGAFKLFSEKSNEDEFNEKDEFLKEQEQDQKKKETKKQKVFVEKPHTDSKPNPKLHDDYEYIRDSEKDALLFEDERKVVSLISRKYYSYSFKKNEEISKKRRQLLDKERRANKPQAESKDLERPDLCDTSSYVLLDESTYDIESSQFQMKTYFDMRYNDIVYSYPKDKTTSLDNSTLDSSALRFGRASLGDLGFETRNIDELQADIKEAVEERFILDPNDPLTICPKSQFIRDIGGEEAFEALLERKEAEKEENRGHAKKVSTVTASYLEDESDNDSEYETKKLSMDPKEVAKRKAKTISKLRNYALIKKIKVHLI